MTVLEAIQRGNEVLCAQKVDSSKLQSELLLAHVLKRPRLNLYIDFAHSLSASEIAEWEGLLRRRAQGEPLQYILGEAWFCGLRFAVTPATLIPRPETELLAEEAWTVIESKLQQAGCVVDAGTGTGCLAISCAKRYAGCQVFALDISEDALEVARANAKFHEVPNVSFLRSELLASLPRELAPNLIISNPPYIASKLIQELPCEVREHEPLLALDGGESGLVFYERLAAEAFTRLSKPGFLILELGAGQADEVNSILQAQGFSKITVRPDYSGIPRIISAQLAISSPQH